MGRRRPSPRITLVCAGIVLFTVLGIRNSFGLLLEPMSADLRWQREVFATAIAVQNLLWGFAQPFVAIIADKCGTGRVMLAGIAFYTIGLVGMANTTSVLDIYLGAAVLTGLGLSGTGYTVVLGAVARAFRPKRRSAALGVASAGGMLGQFAVAPITQTIIDDFGWPVSLLVMAVAAALMTPLVLALTGRAGDGATGDTAAPQALSKALGEAGRHRGYWYLTAGFFVCGFQTTFLIVHFPAYLTDNGMTPMVGAAALALIGFFNVAGTLMAGVLGGRYRKKYLLSGLYFARSILIIVFLSFPISSVSVLVFSVVMGLLWFGTVPLTNGLLAQIFGPRYLATLFGIAFLSNRIGAFFGAWTGGYVFDVTGSYEPVWMMVIGLGLLATVLHVPIADAPVARILTANPRSEGKR